MDTVASSPTRLLYGDDENDNLVREGHHAHLVAVVLGGSGSEILF